MSAVPASLPLNGVFVRPQGLCESNNVEHGAHVWAFAHIPPGARIGRDCSRRRIAVRLPDLSQPELRRVLLVVGLLGLVTVGDGFTYLSWSDAGSLATKYFPLLFVGTSAAYMALAIPFGRMADRAGGARVFLAGHVALFGVYAAGTSGIGGGAWSVLVAPLLLGSFYAATDGLLSALATQSEPEASADSSLVATTTSVGRPLLCAGRLSTARRRHKSLGDIESWRVTVDGRPLRSVDRNF